MSELYVDNKLVAKLQGKDVVHNITLLNGFTAAQAYWFVRNGYCTVVFVRLKASSTGTNRVICSGLPNPKGYVYKIVTDDFCVGNIFLSQTGGEAVANINNTNNGYISYTYPVADDWEET